MQNTIEVRLDDDLAQFYASAPDEYRQKIEILVAVWLRELRDGHDDDLDQLIKRMSREAQARGLTPAILEEILA